MTYITKSSSQNLNNWGVEINKFTDELYEVIDVSEQIYKYMHLRATDNLKKIIFITKIMNIFLVLYGVISFFSKSLRHYESIIVILVGVINALLSALINHLDLIKISHTYDEARILTLNLTLKIQKERLKQPTQRVDAKVFLMEIIEEHKTIECNFPMDLHPKQHFSNKYNINLDKPLIIPSRTTYANSSDEETVTNSNII